jgi:hypothetical protein
MDSVDRILIGIIIALFLSVVGSVLFSRAENKENRYLNYKVIIIEKGGYSERNGKFSENGKYFLVRSISDTTLFTELAGYNFEPLGAQNGSPLYWSKQPGDTLKFDYIRKDRFWRKSK